MLLRFWEQDRGKRGKEREIERWTSSEWAACVCSKFIHICTHYTAKYDDNVNVGGAVSGAALEIETAAGGSQKKKQNKNKDKDKTTARLQGPRSKHQSLRIHTYTQTGRQTCRNMHGQIISVIARVAFHHVAVAQVTKYKRNTPLCMWMCVGEVWG